MEVVDVAMWLADCATDVHRISSFGLITLLHTFIISLVDVIVGPVITLQVVVG